MDYKKFYEIADFKTMFFRDKNFDFQPYPLWTKTSYDINDIVKYEEAYYLSLKDENISVPTTEEDWEVIENPTEEQIEKAKDYISPISYNTGDKVVYINNYKYNVYVSSIDNNYSNPTSINWEVSETETIEDFILDADIEKAMAEAGSKFNPAIFADKEVKKIAFSYLTAFYLVLDLQTAKEGVSSSWSNPIRKKQVGKMAVWYDSVVPNYEYLKRYPSYSFFARNMYGVKYFELIRSKLAGNVNVFIGVTTNV